MNQSAEAKHINIEALSVSEGRARAALEFTPELANIFGMLHGGAAYWLMERAVSLASGGKSPAQFDIHYLAPTLPGERLIATAVLQDQAGGQGLYAVRVEKDPGGELVVVGSALAT